MKIGFLQVGNWFEHCQNPNIFNGNLFDPDLNLFGLKQNYIFLSKGKIWKINKSLEIEDAALRWLKLHFVAAVENTTQGK